MKSGLFAALALSLAVTLAGCGKSGPSTSAQAAAKPAESVPLAMLPRDMVPQHYRVTLTVNPTKPDFSGHTEIEVEVANSKTSYFIHGLDLRMQHAVAHLPSGDSVPAKYTQVHDSGVETLTFAKALPKGSARLAFDYTAPFNTSLSGLYKVTSRGDSYAFTQFENTDARRAFPSFDEPGFKTPFDLTVIAPAADKVIANTPLISSKPSGQTTKWVFATTKPLPTYLVALAVGPLDIVDAGVVPPNQYRSHPLPLRGIAARGMGPKLKYALSLTPAVVTALENYYGVGFPFQKLDTLAVPDFAAGAMENSGAITYREQLLLMEDNAPLEQRRSSLTVQAHEIAHQWFGDLVTPKWWDDIWLNESFATWMEYKIAQMVKPDQEFAHSTLASSLGVMRLDELPSARQIHNPVNNPDDIDNAFDDITYSKGGAVLAMFESFVGPEEFQKGIHAYLTKFAFRNASAQDFIGTIAQTTGHPEIVQAFNEFIDQPHIPLMQTQTACANGGASANVRESTYRSIGVRMPQQRWHVPMCVAADHGAKTCTSVAPGGGNISFGSSCPQTVFPNVEGAGYYRFTMDEAAWRALVAGAPKLSPADQHTLFENVAAAMRAGHATAADFFDLVRALAPVARWDIVDAIRDAAHELRVTGVIASTEVPQLQALIRQEFEPRLQGVGLEAKPGENAAASLLRQRLVEILVEEGRDSNLIQRLGRAADRYIASGEKDRDGLPPELIREAMRAGVISGGAPFGDRVIDAIRHSNDEYFIQSAIYAVAGSDNPATLNKLLALSLMPAIRTGDLRYVQRYYAAESAARPAYWNWLKTNFAALEKRLSRYGMGGTPDIQHYACDNASRSDLQAFLGPKASQLVGMPRTLRQTQERIAACIAFKAAKGGEVNAALAAPAKTRTSPHA
ncbi:MAG: M1 family metallopeptidase [Alphaproteobacteria bacterium]|jgi:alanyl aminopeptidase